MFNKRDYAAAERYWSPHDIQHSAHIEPGPDGLRPWTLLGSRPAKELDRGGHPPHSGWSSRRTLGCASGRGFASGIQEWSTYVRRQFHRVMPRLIRARSSHHGSRSVARREARPRGTGPNRTFLLNRKEEKTTMRVDLKPGNTFPD